MRALESRRVSGVPRRAAGARSHRDVRARAAGSIRRRARFLRRQPAADRARACCFRASSSVSCAGWRAWCASHTRSASRELFAFDDIAAQRAFMARFDTLLWRTLAQNLARRWVMRRSRAIPASIATCPSTSRCTARSTIASHQYFWNHLARDNALLQLVFFGRYMYEPALPIYLNAATYERTKAALEHVHIETITATVDEALEYGASEAFDAFSLSDISSYLDDEAHAPAVRARAALGATGRGAVLAQQHLPSRAAARAGARIERDHGARAPAGDRRSLVRAQVRGRHDPLSGQGALRSRVRHLAVALCQAGRGDYEHRCVRSLRTASAATTPQPGQAMIKDFFVFLRSRSR